MTTQYPNMENEMMDILKATFYRDNQIAEIREMTGFISSSNADRKLSNKYEVGKCYNNIYYLAEKFSKLNPTICRGRRMVNGALEPNPHYWLWIKGRVWDVCQTHTGTEFVWIHVVYIDQKFYEKFGMVEENSVELQSWEDYRNNSTGKF